MDISARQDAVLLLAAINLPGGELVLLPLICKNPFYSKHHLFNFDKRRRSESDELQMRSLLCEGDLISVRIHFYYDDDDDSFPY